MTLKMGLQEQFDSEVVCLGFFKSIMTLLLIWWEFCTASDLLGYSKTFWLRKMKYKTYVEYMD